MGTDSWKELLSFKCNVRGIMFYSGYKSLHSLMKVKFIRDKSCQHDSNAATVVAGGQQLGYMDRSTACYVAPVMDKFEDSITLKMHGVLI